VAYYLIVQHIQTFDQIKRLLMVLFFSATLTSFYGFFQYMHGGDISQYRWVDGEQFPGLRARIFSTMENPNIYAGYLVTVIALAGGMMLTAMQKKVKLWYIGLLCIFCTCLALTYSRGGWVSFLSVLATLALFRSKRLLWLLVAAPLIAVLVNPMLLERLTSIVHPVDSSSQLRMALWESSWAMLMEHPILGIGWGAYWMVYPAYDFWINDSATTIYHAHNMFLHIGAELGFLGLGAFTWLLVSVLRIALALNRRCSKHEICGIALGLAAALIGIIINGLTDHIMFNIQMSIFFWIIAGITVSLVMFIQPGKRWVTGPLQNKKTV
jgi:putative inorganic carbon (HCO3(-)) transporter